MKKLTAFIFLISLIGFFALGSIVSAKVGEPRRPLCLEIKGTFYSNGWTGGNVMVGCGGDWGHALPQSQRKQYSCTGETQVVVPGKQFTLTACSCHGNQGCLYIAKKLSLSKFDSKTHQSHVIINTPLSTVAKFKNNKCVLTAGGKIVANLKAGKTKVCGTNGKTLIKNFKIKCGVPTVTVPPSTCPTPPAVVNVKVTCETCQTSQ